MAIPRCKIALKRDPTIREITREDLPRLLGPRDKSTMMPARLRDSHHTIARMLSAGVKRRRICELTGYTYNRVCILANSPAMIELVANYRAQIDAAFLESQDAYYDLISANAIAAERHISDRIAQLDEEGDLLPIRDAIAISRDAADRTGYGKKQTNVNVNADFAFELEKAIARSGKQIDGVMAPPRLVPSPEPEPIALQATLPCVSHPTPASAPAQPLIRRRA